MHRAGGNPVRGIAQLAAVALSGASKEVTHEAKARMYRSRRPGGDAEVGGPGGLQRMGPQHYVNAAASSVEPTKSSCKGVLSATVGNEGAKSVQVGRRPMRLRKKLGACTQSALRRRGGGNVRAVDGQSGEDLPPVRLGL